MIGANLKIKLSLYLDNEYYFCQWFLKSCELDLKNVSFRIKKGQEVNIKHEIKLFLL